MIFDKETELTSGTALDLESVRPGPGEPIRLWAKLNAAGSLVITTGDAVAAADDCLTVDCPAEGVEFSLPSDTKRYIKSTFAGTVAVISPGAAQTNL